jgi:HSP20 family protein
MKLTPFRPLLPEAANWPFTTDLPVRYRRVFNDLFGTLPAMEATGWSPDVDLVEKNGELLLTAEIPGVKKEDVQLSIDDGVLTLKGEKKVEKEDKGANWRMVERSWGAFERSFTLPRGVDPAGVKAEFKEGVLTVHIPRPEQAVGRRIEINAK